MLAVNELLLVPFRAICPIANHQTGLAGRRVTIAGIDLDSVDLATSALCVRGARVQHHDQKIAARIRRVSMRRSRKLTGFRADADISATIGNPL